MKTSTRGESPLSATPCSGLARRGFIAGIITSVVALFLPKGAAAEELEESEYILGWDTATTSGSDYSVTTTWKWEDGEWTFVRSEIHEPNVKEHAPPLAGASIETGGEG